MTLSLTHTFVSAIPDGTDATVVRPSNWNDTHTVAGTLPIANGGTNTASVPANGQLLIGDGTGYTVANLTAGTGMTITNTAGGITLSAPENGTVTGVTASSPIASSGGTAPNISLTGTVDVPHGGTGATTLTGYVIGNGASAMTASATIPISNLTGTLPVANGGTGQTTYTDGQLLIGNTTGSTLTRATLTAGTGVTITNGNGTITISAPDTGTVTSVTASSPIASSGGATPNLSLGTVPIANGGTNSTATPTSGGVGYGTGTAHAYTAAGTTGQVLTSATAGTPTWSTPTTGTVTSVAQTFTGGIVSVAGSPITSSGTLALTVAGTSGGVPYFSSGSAWATSAALAASAIVLGGGAGAAPATTTTGTGVVTALGVNTGTAGAFVVNGGGLGTPSAGVLTNCTGLPFAGGGITGGTTLATALAALDAGRPAASAYASAAQSVTSDVLTKVTLDVEDFDTASNFASSRFTATVAGYYQVSTILRQSSTTVSTGQQQTIYKNGAIYRKGFAVGGTSDGYIFNASYLIYLAVSDYVEFFASVGGTGPQFGGANSSVGCSMAINLVKAT